MTYDTRAEAPRLGLLCLACPDYTEPVAEANRDRFVHDVEAAGITMVDAGIVYRERDAQGAVERIRGGGVHGVLALVLSWCRAPAVMRVLTEVADLPILLYGMGGRADDEGHLLSCAGAAGVLSVLRPMREANLNFQYALESAGEPTRVEDIAGFARIAAARASIRRSRIGTFGFLDTSQLTLTLDTSRLQLEIGPEVIAFDLLDLAERAKDLPEDACARFRERLAETFDYVNDRPGEKAVETNARLTAAVQAIAEEHGLDGVTVKCVEGMGRSLGLTPCMIGSMLGDDIPFACETDLPGIATHVILRKLTGQPVTFLEVYEFLKDSNALLLGTCGVLPDSMADGPPLARTVAQPMFEGIACASRMKAGRMTLARLVPGSERFGMHIVTGTARAPRDWVELHYTMPPHPSVELEMDGDWGHFMENVSAQHFSVVYGDHAEALSRLCDFLGVSVMRD